MTTEPSLFAVRNPSGRAHIGVARADITPGPDAPINNWGAARRTTADGLATRLSATVITIASLDGPASEPELVIVALDLGWWRTPAAADGFRAGVARRLGVAPERILVSLSHTHAGPAIDPEAVDPAARSRVAEYLETIADTTGEAAVRAVREARPAVLDWGRGSCHLAWVRDQWSAPEGRFVCGFDPAADPDHTLLVGRVISDDHEGFGPSSQPALMAVLVNYACHPTTLGPDNSAVSGDYVAVARDVVEDRSAAPMIFLQGASGELAPRRQYDSGPDAVRANGEQLGYSVLATLAGMLPVATRLTPGPTVESGAPLGTWRLEPDPIDHQVELRSVPVDLPLNNAPRRWQEPDLSPAARAERERRAALIEATSTSTHHRMPLAVGRIGDAALVALAGESYSQLQRDLRSRFSDRPVIVLNLTGGAHHGYLPPASAYETDLYQVWQTPAGPGSLEQVRDAGIAALDELFGRRSGGPA